MSNDRIVIENDLSYAILGANLYTWERINRTDTEVRHDTTTDPT